MSNKTPQKTTFAGSKQGPEGRANGWYLYNGRGVEGPISAKALQSMPEGPRSKVLVSKVGFDRWYRFDEISHILTATSTLERGTQSEQDALEKTVKEGLDRFGVPRPNPPEQSPVVSRGVLGPEHVRPDDSLGRDAIVKAANEGQGAAAESDSYRHMVSKGKLSFG